MGDEHGIVLRTKPDEAIDFVERWIYTPALRELVEADGGTWPTGTLPEVVTELEAFSKVWDFRGGESRLIFKEGDESRTDERAERTYAAARALGLLNPPQSTLTDPDYLLILGGLATGVEPRVRYAAELIHTGRISTGTVAALGSFRLLHKREIPVAETYAPAAQYELDLLTAMMSSAFDAADGWTQSKTGDPSIDARRAESLGLRPGNPSLSVYASRSGEPESRPANTADTYLQFADHRRLSSGSTVLVVTSSIYGPFQHIDAVRILGVGRQAEIETVGVPSLAAVPSHPPSGYLQEIRSGIRSCDRLLGPC